jgi:cell division septal protein FtsQ
MKQLRRFFAAFALIVLGTAIYFCFDPHWVKIENVQLNLSEPSKEDLLFQRIKTALTPQLQKLAGRYVWEIPLGEVYQLVAKDRRVRKVSIYREFPSKLNIVIEPHTPVLAFLGADNRFYPVAADATLLPPQSLIEAQDLPILRGEELKDEQRLREAALELFDLLPNDGYLRKRNISEIVYSRKGGFEIFAAGVPAQINMGESDFGPKISRVERVLGYLESQNIKGRVIDARFAKKVVVRVRNNP